MNHISVHSYVVVLFIVDTLKLVNISENSHSILSQNQSKQDNSMEIYWTLLGKKQNWF